MNRAFMVAVPLFIGFGVSFPSSQAPVSQDAQSPAARRRVVLHAVSFDWQKQAIAPDSLPLLDEAADVLADGQATTVVLAGPLETVGSGNGSPDCAAQIVRQQLLTRGIAPQRLAVQVDGVGSVEALASDDGASCRAALLGK